MNYEPREPEMSFREVERMYKNIPAEYFKDVELNKVNCYKCNCGHITKTINVNIGVTPMFFRCEACGNQATSTFFNDIAPNQKPTWEWYRPSLKETYKKFKRAHAMIDHICMGGLEVRKV